MRFVVKYGEEGTVAGIYEAFRDAKKAALELEGAWVELNEPIEGLKVVDLHEPEPEPDTTELKEDVAELKEDVTELEKDLAEFENEGGAEPPPLPSASAKKSKKKWFEP